MEINDNSQNEKLLQILGYEFKDLQLLHQALTHRSCVNETQNGVIEHNERLEFLGDAVIGLAVGQLLMELLPDAREGILTKLRAMVVSAPSLATVAQNLGLGDALHLGRGEEQTGGRQKASILADAFEALIGAVHMDGGFEMANRVARQLLREMVDVAILGGLDQDAKTRLQEIAQERFHTTPQYHVLKEIGPDHAKIFEIAVVVSDRQLACAQGNSKKQAEQSAARLALEIMEQENNDGGVE